MLRRRGSEDAARWGHLVGILIGKLIPSMVKANVVTVWIAKKGRIRSNREGERQAQPLISHQSVNITSESTPEHNYGHSESESKYSNLVHVSCGRVKLVAPLPPFNYYLYAISISYYNV